MFQIHSICHVPFWLVGVSVGLMQSEEKKASWFLSILWSDIKWGWTYSTHISSSRSLFCNLQPETISVWRNRPRKHQQCTREREPEPGKIGNSFVEHKMRFFCLPLKSIVPRWSKIAKEITGSDLDEHPHSQLTSQKRGTWAIICWGNWWWRHHRSFEEGNGQTSEGACHDDAFAKAMSHSVNKLFLGCCRWWLRLETTRSI